MHFFPSSLPPFLFPTHTIFLSPSLALPICIFSFLSPSLPISHSPYFPLSLLCLALPCLAFPSLCFPSSLPPSLFLSFFLFSFLFHSFFLFLSSFLFLFSFLSYFFFFLPPSQQPLLFPSFPTVSIELFSLCKRATEERFAVPFVPHCPHKKQIFSGWLKV